MNCDYCFLSRKARTEECIPTDDLRRALRTIGSHIRKTENIEFMGGEPTLDMDRLEYAVSFLDEVPISISTNGYYISTRLRAILHQHENIHISVSIDGPRWVNQYRRTWKGTGTHERVEGNILALIDEFGNQRISAHMTVTPATVAYITESVKYLDTLGLRHIGVGIVEGRERAFTMTRARMDRYIREMKHVADLCHVGVISARITELDEPPPPQKHYVKATNDTPLMEIAGGIIPGNAVSYEPDTDIQRARLMLYSYRQTLKETGDREKRDEYTDITDNRGAEGLPSGEC